MIQALIDTLTQALQEEVTLYLEIPDRIEAPAVILAPGAPFIENHTIEGVKEHWQVVVAMSNSGLDRGVAGFRRVSLLIREAASSVGAMWEEASGPQTSNFQGPQHALVINRLYFRYDPAGITADESSSSSS